MRCAGGKERGILPGGIVDQSEFAEIVTLLQCGHRALAVDHHIDGALQQNVPRAALVALVEYWNGMVGIGGKKCVALE